MYVVQDFKVYYPVNYSTEIEAKAFVDGLVYKQPLGMAKNSELEITL